MENLKKRESGMSRVVGVEESVERELLDYFRKQFQENQKDEASREHTPELKEVIARVNEKMVDFLKRYSIDSIYVPPQNIQVLDRSKLDQEKLKRLEAKYGDFGGFFSSSGQGIAILSDYENGNKLDFVDIMVHEMLHLNGFYSYQISSKENADLNLVKPKSGSRINMNVRRSGFSIGTLDGKKLLFSDINESIITELEIRFEHEYFGEWPELIQEIKDKEEYIKFIVEKDGADIEKVRDTIGSVIKEDLPDRIRFRWKNYAYEDARKKFNQLVDDLYARNKKDFPSREAVFSLFAKATMTGKLLPIARLIEKTYGKGSFRKLGEETSKIIK